MSELTIAKQGIGRLVEVTQKVYPWDEQFKPIKKIVTLKSATPRVAGRNHRPKNNNNFWIRGFKMPDSEYWLGFPTGTDTEGHLKWRKLMIRGTKAFNLEKRDEAYELFIWQNSAKFQGSKLSVLMGEKQQDLLIVDDPDKVASDYIAKKKLSRELEDYILKAPVNELKDWGLVFRINPNFTSPEVIQQRLLEKLAGDPKKFMNDIEWNGDTDYLAVKITLRKAEVAGITRMDTQKGYLYKESRSLGHSEEVAIKNVLRDNQLYSIIAAEAQENIGTSEIRSISRRKHENVKGNSNEEEKRAMMDSIKKELLGEFDLVPKEVNNAKSANTPLNRGKKGSINKDVISPPSAENIVD